MQYLIQDDSASVHTGDHRGYALNCVCRRRPQMIRIPYGMHLALTLHLVCLPACAVQKPPSPDTGTVMVFAAAGTRSATGEICGIFTTKTGIEADMNFASSATLARQIAQGAPFMIFISASSRWISYLGDKALLETTSIRPIAGNSLVLIGRKGARVPTPAFTTDFRIKQAAPEHIAIGDPSHVPVGSYTMALFDSLGWTHHLSEKLIMAKDVTAVLRYVELGECDWGFVYSSEALQSDTAVILAHVPPQLHPDITFYIALSTEADVAARKLYSLITGETGQDVFARHGFPAVQVQ